MPLIYEQIKNGDHPVYGNGLSYRFKNTKDDNDLGGPEYIWSYPNLSEGDRKYYPTILRYCSSERTFNNTIWRKIKKKKVIG